ncbi:hypothetical protein BDV19DRAFT_396979 [Aspergillus venezuelensis]
MALPPKHNLSPFLITGGNGFLASHIIDKILASEPNCTIHSLDINTRVMSLAQPVAIFHNASPPTQSSDVPEPGPEVVYPLVLVTGAHNLLRAAAEVKTIKALINTSTSGVITDNVSDIINCEEDEPILWGQDRPPGSPQRTYCLCKTEYEEEIRFANRKPEYGGLLTVSLRPGLVFGERDTGSLGKMISVARQGKSRFQMGNGQNPYDFIYAGNLADAHLVSAWALLEAWGKEPPTDSTTRVDGEIFNVTNDDPWLLWDFQRAVSAAIGKPVRKENIIVIPLWVGLTIGLISKWTAWFGSFLGGKQEASVTRAGRVLGYRAEVGMKEGIERSVRWIMEQKDVK